MEHQRGGARTSRAARAPQPRPPQGEPDSRGWQSTAEALYAPAGPFCPPPSYTHRHCFQVPRAPCRSCPHLQLPPRDLLWGKKRNRLPTGKSSPRLALRFHTLPRAGGGPCGPRKRGRVGVGGPGGAQSAVRELPYRTYPIQLTLQDLPYRAYPTGPGRARTVCVREVRLGFRRLARSLAEKASTSIVLR